MENVKAKVEVKNDAVRPCKTEIRIRKILGLSILILALPFVVFFAIATTGLSLLSTLSIVAMFGIYMLQNKGYNLGKDLFFVLVGLVAYILPFSIFMFGLPPVAPLTMLKGFLLTADWAHEGVGISDPEMYLVFSIINILFFSSASFLFITNIFSKIKRVTVSNKKKG